MVPPTSAPPQVINDTLLLEDGTQRRGAQDRYTQLDLPSWNTTLETAEHWQKRLHVWMIFRAGRTPYISALSQPPHPTNSRSCFHTCEDSKKGSAIVTRTRDVDRCRVAFSGQLHGNKSKYCRTPSTAAASTATDTGTISSFHLLGWGLGERRAPKILAYKVKRCTGTRNLVYLNDNETQALCARYVVAQQI